VLRTRLPVRALTRDDRDEALDVCARDVAANVFVAARIEEGGLESRGDHVLGYVEDGRIDSMCWASSNVVPVESTAGSRVAFAERLRRWRRRSASLLGPREATLDLWARLEHDWGRPRSVRDRQPLMGTRIPPSALGVEIDPRVRPARRSEVDLVLPASAHMFTAEIGYPPYTGSAKVYRDMLLSLIDRGRTYVVLDGGEVVFKADVGSVSLGCAQVQGVWLAPDLRGRGLSVPLMAGVVEQVMIDLAPYVTLYVNDYNSAARATYRHVGFVDIGDFATVLL
jgi:predicted GNAT family acetyltransferase